MAENITILEGQTAKSFTAKKLRTNLQGSGTCLWVPEDEVKLTTKSINKDGTYKAADEEDSHGNKIYYGYSQVTVRGIGKATGYDPEDNNEYTWDTNPVIDPETGETRDELTKTALPSRLIVVQPPNRTTYNDGETIDKTGLRVLAVKNDWLPWSDATHPDGVLEANELTIVPTTADKEDVSEATYSDGSGVNAMVFMGVKSGEDTVAHASEAFGFISERNTYYTPMIGEGQRVLATWYNGNCYVACPDLADGASFVQNMAESDDGVTWGFSGGTTAKGYNHFVGAAFSANYNYNLIESTADPTGLRISDLERIGGTQTITVKWERPQDGKVLTTSFEIEVGDFSSHETEGENLGSGGGRY